MARIKNARKKQAQLNARRDAFDESVRRDHVVANEVAKGARRRPGSQSGRK